MHTIKLKVKGFCGDQESSQVVTIVDDARAKPDGGLSINPTEVCPNQLVNVSVWPGNSPLDSLRVYLGDGKNTRLDELEYGYPSVGEYEVMAIAYNGCGIDTSRQKVNVTTSFMRNGNIYFNTDKLCLGQKLRGSVSSYSAIRTVLNYGDGSFDTLSNNNNSFIHAYTKDGSYTVEATFEYMCGTIYTTTRTLTIGTGADILNFSINPFRSQYCLGETAQFNPPWLYLGDTLDVDYGDGNTARFVNIPNVSKTTISYVVYPNPSNNLVTIKSTINTGNAAITFTDLTGKLMNVETTKRTNGLYASNVSGLSSGIYILDVKQGNQEYRARIVIQR